MTEDDRQAEHISSQIEALPKSMSIRTKAGEIVRFTGVGGSRSDIERACEYLELGQVYVVHSVELGAYASKVRIADGAFNTAMFENT